MSEDDEFRYGDLGYWEYLGDALAAHEAAKAGPALRMDTIVEPDFAERDWLVELERDVLAAVVDGGLLTGRVIVPPDSLDKPAEDLLELGLQRGFEVRVLEGAAPLTIYGGRTAVLPERDAAGTIGHRRVRRRSVITPLQELFELRWAAATDWREHRLGASGVLELLARGWSDAQVSSALGISPRTVSRRVAEAMAAVGARSRFELGMRYGMSRRGLAAG